MTKMFSILSNNMVHFDAYDQPLITVP